MKKCSVHSALIGFLMIGMVSLTVTRSAHAQFTQNNETIRVDVSGYPLEVRQGYNSFKAKCAECHTLDTSLKPSFSSAQWTAIVKRMQAMSSAHLNDKEAQSVLDFLNYDEGHRKAALKTQISTAAATSIGAGQAFYSAQGCDTCHVIAGTGGTIGPTLNGVGSKLSRDQIVKVVKDGKADTTMPALPAGTPDQQLSDLVDYLVSLK